MKKKFLHLVMASCFLGLLPFKTVALNYTITFTGTGASTTVNSVIVQNLTKGTSVTVPAGNVLNLSDVATAVEQFDEINETIRVYPASADGKSMVLFFAKQAGSTQLNAFSLDGRKVAGISTDLQAGSNTFELSLPKGVYVIQVTGNEYAYTAKMLNQTGTQGKPKIEYIDTEKMAISSSQKTKSSTFGITTMTYTTGDQLLYKGISENYNTIVTDVPTCSKTTNFNFIACTDGDGNNYTVVTIGTQTWMAENLKTTRYKDGTAVPFVQWNKLTFTPGYSFSGSSDVGAFGDFYNWYTVNTGKLAPIGWHVPTDAEWTTLENYLIWNGYNYDGSTSEDYLAKSLASTTDWATEGVAGSIGYGLLKNNRTGFSALPCYYGSNISFWWSSTEYQAYQANAWYRSLGTGSSSLYRNYTKESAGLSIRCVRDN